MQVTESRALVRRKRLKQRQTGWIGVDVGTSTLKLAQVEWAGSQWRIANSLIVPSENQGSAEDAGLASGWIEQSVRNGLVENTGFRGRRAACVLPMSSSSLRTLEVPAGSEAELRDMIVQELADEPDEEFEDKEFDFWETDTRPIAERKGMTRLTVLSVSRRLVNDVATELLNAGVRCDVMDGIPFALTRAVDMVSSGDQSRPVVALDWGFTTAVLTVAVGGHPVFTRCLRECGLKSLIEPVSDALGLSLEECRHLLTIYGIPSAGESSRLGDLQQAIAELAAEPLSRLIDELSKTLSYFRQQRTDLIPSVGWLLGGGATIRNVAPWLSTQIEIPFHVWRLATRSAGTDWASDAETALLGPAAALSALGGQI